MPVICFTTIIHRCAACLSNSAQGVLSKKKGAIRLRDVPPLPYADPATAQILRQRRKYVRFTAGGRIISSSYDVFANAQRIVKVKEAKSEERTVMKS
jgi:hypothetical protein